MRGQLYTTLYYSLALSYYWLIFTEHTALYLLYLHAALLPVKCGLVNH